MNYKTVSVIVRLTLVREHGAKVKIVSNVARYYAYGRASLECNPPLSGSLRWAALGQAVRPAAEETRGKAKGPRAR